MMRSLIRYHGAEPPLSFSTTADDLRLAMSREQALIRECRCLLQLHIAFYSPSELLAVDRILHAYRHHEKQLVNILTKQAARRDAILRYFSQRNPSQMAYAVQLAREWFGWEGQLLLYLDMHSNSATAIGGGGAIATVPLRSPLCPPIEIPESRRTQESRERIVEYLRQYLPERLGDVDALVEAFAGRDEELFGMLKSRSSSSQPLQGGGGALGSRGAVDDPKLLGARQTSPSSQHVALMRPPVVTFDFSMAVMSLVEALALPDDPDVVRVVDCFMGKLLGTGITEGEVLLRIAAEIRQWRSRSPDANEIS